MGTRWVHTGSTHKTAALGPGIVLASTAHHPDTSHRTKPPKPATSMLLSPRPAPNLFPRAELEEGREGRGGHRETSRTVNSVRDLDKIDQVPFSRNFLVPAWMTLEHTTDTWATVP